MVKKLKLAILFGGKSVEHEVSLMSAKNIISSIDKNKYEIKKIKIGKNGKMPKINFQNFDVIFPVLHGTFGEEGSIQGFFKILNIPYVGTGILGSAICMDKVVTKKLLERENIKVAKYLTYEWYEKNKIGFTKIQKYLGMPFFVKPANCGSSVGVNKISDKKEFDIAILEAFKFDNKILIEECIKGRELECSVLGNENPKASIVGEIITNDVFYTYNAKYIDENGAKLDIPANLPKEKILEIQKLAVKAYKILQCEGMARVDMFLKDSGEIIINELNTIPGFTNISMYPKLWEVSGISQTELIDILISLALTRHKRESKLSVAI